MCSKKMRKKKTKPFQIVFANSCLGKNSLFKLHHEKKKQNNNLWKGSLMEEKIKTDPRFARVGRVLRCHRACHVTPSKNATATDASSSSSHSSSNQSKAKRKSTNQPTDRQQDSKRPPPPYKSHCNSGRGGGGGGGCQTHNLIGQAGQLTPPPPLTN